MHEYFVSVSATTMPEKITIYTCLAGLLNVENFGFGGEFVDGLARRFRDALSETDYSQAELTVCLEMSVLEVSPVGIFLVACDCGQRQQQFDQPFQPCKHFGSIVGSHVREEYSSGKIPRVHDE